MSAPAPLPSEVREAANVVARELLAHATAWHLQVHGTAPNSRLAWIEARVDRASINRLLAGLAPDAAWWFRADRDGQLVTGWSLTVYGVRVEVTTTEPVTRAVRARHGLLPAPRSPIRAAATGLLTSSPLALVIAYALARTVP